MSVADKLRALDKQLTSLIENAPQTKNEELAVELFVLSMDMSNALPALIEVVEQAERWGSLEEFNVDTLEHVPTPLGAALAALDAALGGEK